MLLLPGHSDSIFSYQLLVETETLSWLKNWRRRCAKSSGDMIPSSLLLLMVTDLKEVELGTTFLNATKREGPASLTQISFLASSLPLSPTASVWHHHFNLAAFCWETRFPGWQERQQKHGHFSPGFGELNLSANGLCHKASVGRRWEMKMERGRGPDNNRSGAKENMQEAIPVYHLKLQWECVLEAGKVHHTMLCPASVAWKKSLFGNLSLCWEHIL